MRTLVRSEVAGHRAGPALRAELAAYVKPGAISDDFTFIGVRWRT